MSMNKQEKFKDLETMPNVFQNYDWSRPQLTHEKQEVVMKGKWKEYFQNDHPIVLELACGYGEYSMAIAKQHPEKNVIGIDMKGNRLWTGATFMLDNGLKNAAFIRSNIDRLPFYFAPQEVSEIWIPFADPYRKPRKAIKRLTSSHFLDIYRQIMVPNGLIHVKTDSDILYEFTMKTIATWKLEIVKNYPDLYQTDFKDPLLGVKTRYEAMNPSGSDTIKYVCFKLS
ncbi:MAG: tRNA (guanosine(46)-N7)-methyltransferase TrmB [Chitinophagales bacterium]